MTVAVFHPGTQHSRQTALALWQLGELAFLATGIFDHPDSRARQLARRLPATVSKPLEAELDRFAFADLPPGKVRAMPQFELPERLAARAGFSGLAAKLDQRLNHAFGKRVARMVEKERVPALWGYDGSSFSAFADPRTAASRKILDRTMAHSQSWNEERERIAETHGDWLGEGSPAWGKGRLERDEIEYERADAILCPSPFVMESIERHSRVPDVASKLKLLPYCFDERLFGSDHVPEFVEPAEPVRFLFVGQVAARKGVQHALEAIDRLPAGAARLTLLGPVALPDTILARYRDRVDIMGPVPRAQVPAIMRDHHALVFPSHNEGSAVVLLEAMASGLAIIQTAASGLGASEHSGFVLPQPTSHAVEEAMLALIEDRDRLHQARLAAMAEARMRNFAAYRDRIQELLVELEF